MANDFSNQEQILNPEGLARHFSRLGWIGFWIQLALVSAALLLMLYVVFLASPESVQSKGIDLSNYLSYGSSGVGKQWQATCYTPLDSGTGYVLWSRSDTGQAALWKVAIQIDSRGSGVVEGVGILRLLAC